MDNRVELINSHWDELIVAMETAERNSLESAGFEYRVAIDETDTVRVEEQTSGSSWHHPSWFYVYSFNAQYFDPIRDWFFSDNTDDEVIEYLNRDFKPFTVPDGGYWNCLCVFFHP